jgi:hypothetical protein
MGLTDLRLIFDNPQRTYVGGQTVSGRLVVKIDAPEPLRSIIVEFRGRASYVMSDGSGTYTDCEKYFEKYLKVFGGRGYTEVLQSGEHYFQFSMILPNNLPSSFEGKYGYVRYRVKATLDRPWKLDYKEKAFFYSSLTFRSEFRS